VSGTKRPHGVVLLAPGGAFVYLPKPGFVGTDTFTYRVSDGVNSSNTATAIIEVVTKKKHNEDDDDDDDDDGHGRD
jgi:Big-like domain-containing protein